MQPPRNVPSRAFFPCIPPPPKPDASPQAYSPWIGRPSAEKARAVEVRLQPTQRLAGEHLEPHSDERTLRGIQDPVRRCDADDLVAEELSRIVDVVDLGVLAKRIVQLRVAVFDNASQGLFVDLRGGIIGELVHAIDKRVQ